MNSVPAKDNNLSVEELENFCMDSLIQLLNPLGEVLQFGFNKGYLANLIQSKNPTSHTLVVSPNSEEMSLAKKWAKDHPNVTLMENTWEKALPELGKFNTVVRTNWYFEVPENVSNKDASFGQSLLKKEEKIIELYNDNFPSINTMRYSDSDLSEFFDNVDTKQRKELSVFISELKARNQISDIQYDELLKRYNLEKVSASLETPLGNHKTTDIYDFVSEALTNHLQPNGNLAFFLDTNDKTHDDPKFFDNIITNPMYKYQETPLSLNSKTSIPVEKSTLVTVKLES